MKNSEAKKYVRTYLKEHLGKLGYKANKDGFCKQSLFGELSFYILSIKQLDVRIHFSIGFNAEVVNDVFRKLELDGGFFNIQIRQPNLAVAGHYESAFYYPKNEQEVYQYLERIVAFYKSNYHDRLAGILSLEDQYCFIDDEFEKLNISMNYGTVCTFLLLAKVVDEENYLKQKKRIFTNPNYYHGRDTVAKMVEYLESTTRAEILELMNITDTTK